MKKLMLILALGIALAACAGETSVVVVKATPASSTVTPSPPTATPLPPTATSNPPTIPPTASPEPQLIFEDDFESGESEWFVGDFPESSTYVSDGQLFIELNRADWAAWTEHPEFGMLEDSILEVDISFISGSIDSAAGIVFRCLGEGGDFLKIVFNADGFLVVAVTNIADGGYFELVPWTRYVDIEPGQAVNHVRVIDDDQQFNMFINDQHVADLNFSDMVPPGCPSLFAQSFDQAGAVWAFDNFRVREVGGTDNVEADAFVPTVPEPTGITDVNALVGSYKVQGTNPDGSTYKGELQITTTADGQIKIHWLIAGQEYVGSGRVTEDGQLYVQYEGGFEGDGTWRLMENGDLHGTWQGAGSSDKGSENWTKE